MMSFYFETEYMSLKEEKNMSKKFMSLVLHTSNFPSGYYWKKTQLLM